MFANYEKIASEKLVEIKRKNLFREYPVINLLPENPPFGTIKHPNIQASKHLVTIWGNNNYLGLSSHPEIIKAKIEATKKYGAGAGGTRNVLGTSEILNELEKKVANWYGKEKALIHISALDANIGVLSALLKNFNAIALSDEKNHASIIDGIKLSGADKKIFKHNNIKDIEDKLSNIRKISDARPVVIIIESIYSMEGDFAPLKEIINLKNKYNALLYIDEVHAVGLRGDKGCGLAEELKLLDQVDLICGTFAKAMGVSGGFVVGSHNMIEFLRHHSRNFIFTTAMSADNAAACLKSIEIISSSEGKYLRKKHSEIVNETRLSLLAQGVRILSPKGSHILPVLIGDENITSKIAKDLLNEFDIAVTPIFAPTVPANQARLRINPTPYHTTEMINKLAEALSFLLNKYSGKNNSSTEISIAENDNLVDSRKSSSIHLASS